MLYTRSYVFDELKDKDFNKWIDNLKSQSEDQMIGYRAKRNGDIFNVVITYSNIKPERKYVIKGNDGYYTGRMYTNKGNKNGLFDPSILNARLYKHHEIAQRTIKAMKKQYINCSRNNLIVEEI